MDKKWGGRQAREEYRMLPAPGSRSGADRGAMN